MKGAVTHRKSRTFSLFFENETSQTKKKFLLLNLLI